MKTTENSKTYMKTKQWLSFSFLLVMLMTVVITSFGQTNPKVEKAFYLIDVEKPKAGMALLEEAVNENPLDAAVLYSLGYAHLKAGNKTKALETFEKGIALDDKEKDKEALNIVGKAHLLLLDKKPAEAKPLFDLALKMTKSKNVDVLNAIADAYLSDNKYLIDAITLLQRAKDVGPNVTTYILLGDAHLQQHQAGLAVSAYEDGALVKKTDPKPHYKVGLVYILNRNVTAVEEAFNKAIAIDPKYAPVYIELAEMYYVKKEGVKAAQNYEKYLSLIESPSAIQKEKLPYYLFMAKDYAKANAAFAPYLSKPDVSPTTLKFAAFSLSEAGELEKSRITMEKFMKVAKPEDLDSDDYGRYGKLLSKLIPDPSLPKEAQDTRKRELDSLAARAYTKSIELNPDQPMLLENLADLQFKLAQYPEAAESYKKLIAMNIKPSGNLYNLGRLYYASAQYAKADSTFIKFQELQPTLLIGYLWEARSKSAQDPDQSKGLASATFEKVVEKASVDRVTNKKELIEAYNYLGPYYYNVKHDINLAKAAYQHLVELDPANAEAHKASLADIRKFENAQP